MKELELLKEDKIGEYVKVARKNKKLTQSDLGKLIDMTKQGVSKIELNGQVGNCYRERLNLVLGIKIPLKQKKVYISKKGREAIIFGRWLLKHCTPVYEGQFLTWAYGEGKYVDTKELYDIFKSGQ